MKAGRLDSVDVPAFRSVVISPRESRTVSRGLKSTLRRQPRGFPDRLFAARRAMCVVTVWLFAMTAGAADPVPADHPAQTTWRYRRVYVPEDQLDRWPRGNTRYVPMEAAEFERMAALLAPEAETVAHPPTAQIARAIYSARLTAETLTDGEATLRIEHSGSEAAVVRLDPCRLAVESPRWSDDSAKTDNAKTEGAIDPAAELPPGMLGAGPDGTLLLRVTHSGTLKFHWSLRGQRETGGTLAFALDLPACPSNQLRLTLPPDLTPTTEQGLVSPMPVADSNGAASAVARQWDIELGGQHQTLLRVAKQNLFRDVRPLTLVRQSSGYDFSARGVQLSAELTLDILGEPLRRVPLLLDEPLTLVTARYGETQIPWTEDPVAAAKPGGWTIPTSLPPHRARTSRTAARNRPSVAARRGRPAARAWAIADDPAGGWRPLLARGERFADR